MTTVFKKIKDYTQEELNMAIENAVEHVKLRKQITENSFTESGLDFYKILNGIDAYFERRRRKEESESWSGPFPRDIENQ